jgi:hypothetical protein
MAKITPFGGVRVTLFPGLSFTLRSSNIKKLFSEDKEKKHDKSRTRQLDLPGMSVPGRRDRKR